MRALVAALWQSDAAFPSGGFAFSGGVEAAAAAGPLDAARLGALMETALTRRWALSERPALWHALQAADLDALAEIDAALEAATLCEPFRVGSRRNGRAFLTAHRRLGTPGAQDLEAAIRQGRLHGHLAAAQGWIWRALGLGRAEAAAASAYLVAAGMANAAVRLGALGALESQRALADALPCIEDLAAAPFDAEAPLALSSAALWLDVVTARHARAHLRLFAN
jgi:urease accessory protein